MPKGPRPKHGVAMTSKQRQAAYRARKKAAEPAPRVVLVRKPPVDRRSRAQRWRDAVEVLTELQGEYMEWRDTLPEAGGSEATREALDAICDVDLSELEGIEPPMGFGRDG